MSERLREFLYALANPIPQISPINSGHVYNHQPDSDFAKHVILSYDIRALGYWMIDVGNSISKSTGNVGNMVKDAGSGMEKAVENGMVKVAGNTRRTKVKTKCQCVVRIRR
jgi:hypothetical protein